MPSLSLASQEHLLRKIQPRLIGNDLRIEPGRLELAGYVYGRIVVLFAGRHMGDRGQCFELFLGQFGVGNGQEILIDFGLPAKVTETQNLIGKGRNLAQDREVSQDQQRKNKPSCQCEGDIKV